MFKGSHIALIIMAIATSAFGQGLEMVQVPSGKLVPFWLSPVPDKKVKSTKTKSISIRTFQAMKFPVTAQQFQKFLVENPQWNKDQVASVYADKTYLESSSQNEVQDRTPITNVSWFAARAFCAAYDMHLPTVNQWEYMAAASETKADANKDEKFLRRILDWYGEPRENGLKPVGSIYQNIYGVWDLHGLIWEWVEDFNTSFVTGESREDSSFNKNMFCGAGAMSGADKENYAAFMRFAFRSSLKGRSSAWNLGFRCVK